MITLRRLEARGVKSLRDVAIEFPRRGAVLVEGPNESGKSTLFEAVYFGLYGAPIVTEESTRSLESLIAHGEERARVCLELQATDAYLRIERTLRRGKPTQATLTVTGEDRNSERITGVRAVNARVVEEMGGLDGAALLNSCFVEQKKLSKLEELDARERRDSLLRILNLDQLSRLEELYRVRPADEQRVSSAESLVELSRASARAAEAEAAVQRARAALEKGREARLRSALLAAELELEAAEEHLHALQALRRLEEASGDGARDTFALAEAELASLRARRSALLLTGVAVPCLLALSLALFLVVGPVPAALALVAALLVAAFVAARTPAAAAAVASKERELSTARAERHGRDARAQALRASLGLPAASSVADELARATRAAGAAEQAAVQARLAVQSLAPAPVGDGEHAAEGATEEELARAEAELAETRARVRYLEETLGADARSVDPRECEEEHAAARRELVLKRRASVILAEARRRIVDRVLPETERNMKLLLPALTAGRYHDARVTGEYRVELWDEEAGRFVGKNLYSGGTKDQVSLALRLAFAIASLPQELGASPGFLFMDEPLSSFDEERTRALIELITRGELAAVFPQIYIISHSRSFDSSLFPYVIRMHGGEVAYSNLPNGLN